MSLSGKFIESYGLKFVSFSLYFFLFLLVANSKLLAQPLNNDCSNASAITIGSGGFGLGVFTSNQSDITTATLQTGETFAPAILVAGQNQKSVWYKFSLPTARALRVTLAQPGSLITAGDAGFAVYKTNNCLPTGADISTKLTPIGVFGNTYHPCVENGDYLVQVSSKAAANGPIYITVETGLPTAAYDQQAQAYNFGVLPRGISTHPGYAIACQSLEDAGEVCSALGNSQDYNKSTWHVFTTPAYLDNLSIVMGGWPTAAFKFGFKIYQGDVRSTPYSSLPVAWGCDSLVTDGYSYANKVLGCGALNPNTTYSLQLLYDKNYNSQITLELVLGGQAPTIAPEPILSAITPTTNNLGVLLSSPTGITTSTNDNLACNSRHAIHPCAPSLPAAGVTYAGENYTLSSFFMFSLSATSTIQFTTTPNLGFCNAPLLLRLYNQSTSNSCATLDPANIINTFITSQSVPCLPPGNYTLQVIGVDTNIYNRYCPKGSLGSSFTLSLTVKTGIASNKFNLSSPGAYDTINRVSGVMQPLVSGTLYTSRADTFGCTNTVMPLDVNCTTGYTKTIYTEFIVPDSGIVSLFHLTPYLNYKLYNGDANSLAITQNAFSFPATISGLAPQTLCLNTYRYAECDGTKVCVLPGTYTETVFGNTNQIGVSNQLTVRYNALNTIHYNLATAEDMGDILNAIPPTGGTVASGADYFSCKDNAIVIDGFQPCKGGYGSTGTKAIYRQFYLSRPASVTINSLGVGCDISPLTLFKGKATDGAAALTVMPAPWRCFTNTGLNICNTLPAGWYTVVAYGFGPSYQNPMRDLNDVNSSYPQYSSMVGFGNKINIAVAVSPCAAPKYNRPYKAAIDTITNQPFLLQWAPRVGHTAAYPKTDTTYTLYTENFNCTNDTPFLTHPIISCSPSATKVAYWVFKLTQESFVSINTDNYWNGSPYAYTAKVYAGNARNDSAGFASTQPIQPCLSSLGHIQLCKLQPGEYTLVLFATADAECKQVTPKIYIDQVGYSRFDHASNAYDFGQIRPDSVWYNGKPGEVNPLNPGRAASNDFFYCTTGAQSTDPLFGCASAYLPSIYNSGNNNPLFTSNYIGSDGYSYPLGVARNLWYTFTVDKGGLVKVTVNNKTIGKGWQYSFQIYKSNVNGTLPFSTVVASGGVDSTMAQGLALVANNDIGYCDGVTEVSFFRQTCTPIPERYYIVVANRVPSNRHNHDAFKPELMYPNHQVEVSILFDSINAVLPKFDHYYQANNIGTNLGPGTYTGATDNFSCATRDATDPTSFNPAYEISTCTKTLWYKFSTTVSGVVKPTFFLNNLLYSNVAYPNFLQLYRQTIPGDSTSNGLETIDFYNGPGEACITPGTYYILLPNCGLPDGYVYPKIELIENAGDFCNKAVTATLTGAGSIVSSATINCHTIGTDYGEFNPTLTCPAGAVTNQYKTTWFKISISGSDTLDVTTYLGNRTDKPSSQIKYRLMNGNCGAMQERSCVLDALTQDTYKCLAPGDYWVQAFSPANAKGIIDLNLIAVKHADTCAPINPCLSNANFQMQFDCTVNEAVRFINYSTYGSSVSYLWDFGYNGQTSTVVSPSFVYPSLTIAQKYYISLKVTNISCGGVSTYRDSITIPARPVVNIGRDTVICRYGSSMVFDAAAHSGATYNWYNGSSQSTLNYSGNGSRAVWVEVTYNNCKSRDTVSIWINPIAPKLLQTKALCSVYSVSLDANQGLGEIYKWNTGANTSTVIASQPGYYWCDLLLNGCTIRDSFLVISTSLNPLGNDKTICQSSLPYLADATVSGATGYSWQDNSTSATYSINKTGLYWVDISLGGCTFRDTLNVVVDSFTTINSAAQICEGQSYILPSGLVVNTAGIYRYTTRSTITGCDSIIKAITLTVNSKPNLGADKSISICAGKTANLTTQFTTTGLTTDWTIGGAMVANPAAVSQAGLYRLIATNGAGCVDTAFVTLTVDTRPDVGADKSTSICPGFTINLTTQFITTGLTTAWTLAGANVGTPTAVATAGAYQLIASNSTGCSDTALVNVSVNPKPGLGSDKTVNICPGFSADLTTQFTTTGLTQSWSLSGAPIGSPTAITASGIYQLIAANGFGCTDTALVTVTVNAKPLLGNDTAVAICSGNAVNLTSLYPSTGLTSNWTTGGTSVANPSSITAVGSYQLIATNGSGCKDTALVSVTVNSKPAIGADKSVAVCPGFSADLTTQYTTTGLTTSWTIGGASVRNPVAVNAAGNYRLIVSNSFGCSDTAFVTVSLIAKPTLGIDKLVNICPGFSTNLTTQFVTTGLTANWSFNNAAIASPTAIAAAGIYELIAGTASGCSDTALVTVSINAKPNLGIDKAAAICAGSSYDLSSQFTTAGLTTNWTLNGGAVANTNAVTTAGVYQLIVTNTSGCNDTALLTLTVNPKPALGADKTMSICQDNSADLTTQFSTMGLSTNWIFNGTTVGNPSAVTTAGIYQLIAINSSNCSDTATVTITVNPKPALGSDKSVSICSGNSINLNNQFTTTGLTTSWTLNGGAVTNPDAVTLAGTYQLIVTNTSGCKDTALITLTLYPKPVIGADKVIGICQGNTADLTAQFTTTGLTTNWTLNGTTVANPNAVTTGGVYQLIAVNSNGCSDTALVTLTISPKPNLGADKSVAICAGNAASLTTQFTITGLTSSWTNSGNAVNNPGAITTAGVYQLIATSSAGCKDTATVTITVAPKPTLGADKATVICSGNTVNLTTQFLTTGFTSNWTINGTAVTTPAAVNQSGIYQLIVTNSNGCLDTALFTLTVNPSPTLGADKVISFCAGGSINLTSQFVTTGLTSAWSLNGNTIALPTAITAPGIYRLVVVNNSGCTDTALVTVSINMLPTVLVKDPAPVCTPANVNLTAASVTTGSTPGLSYTYWSDAATTITLPNAGAVQSGLYYIKGTDAKGCFDSRPVTVTVYTLPIVNAGRDTAICDQSYAILIGNATNLGIGTVKYLWSPVSGLSNTTTARTFATPGGSATYRLTATVDYGTCVLSVSDDVRITMQPPVVAFAGNDTVAVSGVPHQLRASGGVNYLWSPASVLNNSAIVNPLATLRQDTRFTVLVTDIAGCKASATVLVKVYNGITYYLPNAFSPNGDGLNEVFRPIPAGIVSTEYFRIFSRYGQLIFETAQPLKGWDGTYKGIRQPVGNYVWSIKGMGSNGKIVEMKGNVVLVR